MNNFKFKPVNKKEAAEEYFTFENTIKRCVKEDSIFRGIIKWKKI